MATDVSSTDLNSKNMNFFSIFFELPMIGLPGSKIPPALFNVSNKNSLS